eukprot:CAMPEP_0185726678 /NCGR_PEP_ID=MMETSP1171-20130828/2575_1 /TAXON_ID=374046 /ORGANISM="Helicotheca tamensis, Strain CCMP826" /LENGTH=199 /DNA_ID=CAMNT_0028395073 /DNA_START=148 /DNA_END=747 /DNA_ORIENTATION=+
MTGPTISATILVLLFAKSSSAFTATDGRIWGQRIFSSYIQSSPWGGEPADPSYYPQEEAGGGEEENPSLLLGEDVASKLEQLKDKYPTNENAYLAAARQRSVDAKAKYLAEVEAEDRAAEEKRRRKAAEAESVQTDYGPGDLSQYQDYSDDGFENSEGNDESGGWGELNEPQQEEEEPSLFIPGGGDDDATGGSGLLLG